MTSAAVGARVCAGAREQLVRWASSFPLFAVCNRACLELGVRACALRVRLSIDAPVACNAGLCR
eukprot:6930874-Lingulodinium_polyedra.AAC.1